MSIDPNLRSLNIDIPACPDTLVKLSLLMGQDDAHTEDMSALIGGDMALASAIVRTVNSAMFGLLHRVETVHEAVRYLGMREVAGITFEMGLRAAFPPGPLIDQIWDRASLRGLAMGRVAQKLDISPWLAHTAGLFAESGRAVLYAYDRDRYTALEARAPNEAAVIAAEIVAFGVSHAALGAALCHSWGLANDIGAFVRARVQFSGEWAREPLDVRHLLAIGATVDAVLNPPADEPADPQLGQRCANWAELAGLDVKQLIAAVEAVCTNLQAGDAA
jgi:HD-like signal output (HDOD) protein